MYGAVCVSVCKCVCVCGSYNMQVLFLGCPSFTLYCTLLYIMPIQEWNDSSIMAIIRLTAFLNIKFGCNTYNMAIINPTGGLQELLCTECPECTTQIVFFHDAKQSEYTTLQEFSY